MAEDEINYASVVFKSNKNPPSDDKKEEETVCDEVKVQHKTSEQSADTKEFSQDSDKKDEETVYDEVKVQHKTSEQSADTKGFSQDSDKIHEETRRPHCQCLACCLGILCVILLSGIIAMMVHLALKQTCDASELKQLKDNLTALLDVKDNLTNRNQQLSSENEELNRNYSNLQVQYENLTQAYSVLERNITNLTAQNQELESQRDNLTQQIKDMETKWKDDNVTRAQWSIDQYCPKDNNGRTCEACQQQWYNNQSSCYAVNNAERSNQKTWEEAREDCRGKNSDLAVIVNEAQKKFTTDNSWKQAGISGYWIGLKVEDGRWKWVDGTNLTNDLWIEPPVNGRCATSLQSQGWKSVNCADKNAWICGKKPLSV
ncbi:C-type lectin domain family 10 member A MMGL Macrophage asialoglycoprotein-binding protein 1 [Channa argus]|uniref:C-type lectin domain family 10 member A MMGL Macrophage asialoglycoprotein-binding protein 1 n=1 Tax=Channa argus TaxID=215402 RepID=A0A6G1PQV4_CHAAH|nr:C-type lectin domain family 10 member A MMGL Macrophage asialoglycoprotein-binding protein 1 [Channa argus]